MCIYPHRRNQCIWTWMWLTHEHRWELLMGLKICGVIRTASWNSIKAFTALQMSRHPPRTGSQGDKDAMTVSNEAYSKTAIWMACATHCNLSDGNPIFWYQLIPISHCNTMMDNATTDYMRTCVFANSHVQSININSNNWNLEVFHMQFMGAVKYSFQHTCLKSQTCKFLLWNHSQCWQDFVQDNPYRKKAKCLWNAVIASLTLPVEDGFKAKSCKFNISDKYMYRNRTSALQVEPRLVHTSRNS